jgi:hypothetical protein
MVMSLRGPKFFMVIDSFIGLYSYIIFIMVWGVTGTHVVPYLEDVVDV